MEEALYDTPTLREFAVLDVGEDHLPDESTILRFRHLLETHNLSLQILATVNAMLTAKGLLLKQGTVVDATLIAAPNSTKKGSGTRGVTAQTTTITRDAHSASIVAPQHQKVLPALGLRGCAEARKSTVFRFF